MEVEKFDPDRFNKFLIEQAKLIREQVFDLNQIIRVHEGLQTMIQIWELHGNQPICKVNNFAEATFEFNLACQIAYSNYRRENKTMWTTIFGWGANKIPKLDVSKMLNK